MINEILELKPLLKYPGGKTAELQKIIELIPQNINNYIEPFVGGGAVYFAVKDAKQYFINDISHELMMLYNYVRVGNPTFIDEIKIIIENWKRLTKIANEKAFLNLYLEFREKKKFDLEDKLRLIIDTFILDEPLFNIRNRESFRDYLNFCLKNKYRLIKKNEQKKQSLLSLDELQQNIEAGLKASYYTYLRDVYNKPKEYNRLSEPRKVAIYLFIREYCYSSMFRFNKFGEFNVPYGGVSYNKKTLENKIEYFKNSELRQHLKRTTFSEKDFEEFVTQLDITADDFMFLDPPYDTTFSEYDNKQFGKSDQERLADYLINRCPCKFLLVIKETDYINGLYRGKGLKITEENKNYYVSFKNRNAKHATHLFITNY